MPPFTTLGTNSKTTILSMESHKLAIEFEAAAAVKKGQLVKLDTTGKVTPWAKADLQHTIIGMCHDDAAIGELVTVHTRGYALIYGISNAIQNAGLATFESFDTSNAVNGVTGYSKFSISAVADQDMGWALDAATAANQLIRVLIRD